MSKSDVEIVAGLDIGTTKIAVVVGAVDANNEVEIIGIGTHTSTGLRRGVVNNIEATVTSIRRAVEEAELLSNCEINSVYAGIAGEHISGKESKGIVAIRSGEVTQYDVDKVIDAAKAIAIPTDKKILHVLPKQYIIDGQSGILEPIGMAGVRLEADVHIVTGSVTAAKNIVKCVHECGLEVDNVVLEQLASSHAVLTDDEKELGVCLVDIGGGTTDIAVFTDGTIRHTSNIPMAGDSVTNDIAYFLNTTKSQAEEVKTKYACAVPDMVSADEEIVVPSLNNKTMRRLARQSLAEVVRARYQEIFELVQNDLARSGYDGQLAAGIVLTGGSSRIEGAVELAEEMFNKPVKISYPSNISGLSEVVQNPSYATAVGLLKYGIKHRQQEDTRPTVETINLWEVLRQWVRKNF
jgi:cell division protein FtsA